MIQLEEKWVLTDLAPPTISPIAIDGILLLGSHDQHRHVVVQFVSVLNGRLLATYRYPNAHLDGVVALNNQFILTLTTHDLLAGQGQVIAFGADGKPAWSYVAGHNLSAPTVCPDGIAYVQDTKQIVMLTPEGKLLATIPLPEEITWRAIQYHAGLFYMLAETLLCALLPNGTEVWRASLTHPQAKTFTDFAPLPVADSLLVVVSSRGYLCVYDQDDGTLLWIKKVGERERPLFPATDHQRLYVGAREGLFTYDLQGNAGWFYAPKTKETHQIQAVLAPPVIVDGRIYLTSRNRRLEILDTITGSWHTESAQASRGFHQTACILLVEDEILAVVADAGGTLYGWSHRNPAIKRINIEQLTEEMWQRFSDDTLKDLGFRLKNRTSNRHYLYDALPAEGLRGKINELLDLADRQDKLELVVTICRLLVPIGNWDEVYE